MYITDATHFLDEKGAIGPKDGPALEMSEFFGSVIVAATLSTLPSQAVRCFKCSHEVHAVLNKQDKIEWACGGCDACGVISNWRGTLWDMTENNGAHAV